MGLFEQWPYTNLHTLNLDWILEVLKDIEHTMNQFVAINALKYADPIQWNITSQYEKNTIVIDPATGTAYISVQPVPVGVLITNTDYWSVVFDLERFVTGANSNFTSRVEAQTTLNATFPTNIGEWLIWEGVLYRALTNIIPGDQYVVDSNISRITIEEIKNEIYNDLNQAVLDIQDQIGDLDNLTTTDKSNLVNAINEVLTTLSNTTGDLSDLTTTDKSNLVNAINEIASEVLGKIGDLNDLSTQDKTNLVNAINETVTNISNLALKLDNSKIVNVLDFGATGDGVTDDTAAIQAAIATLKHVYFPAGRYLISDTLIINNEQTFFGVNEYDSIITSAMTDKPLISGAITDPSSIDTTPLRYAAIKNLGISIVQATRSTPIILFVNSVFCELDHVYVINGINADDHWSCVMLKAADYHTQPSWEARIHDCHFHMVRLWMDYCSDSYIYNNYFNDVVLTYAFTLQNSSGAMVNNNQIIGELAILNTQYLIIIDNYFDGGGVHDSNYTFFGISGRYELANIIITNNRFYKTPKCGIVLDGSLNLITISNNNFEDCDYLNGGYNDIQINQSGSYNAAMTLAENKHRHLYCWDLGSNHEIARSGATNNGKPYQIVNYTTGLIIVRDAMLFNPGWYAAATATGAVKFIACYPDNKFPEGSRGLAVTDSGRKSIAFTFTDDKATGHIDYNVNFVSTPITIAQYYGSTLHDAFMINTANADETGFDVVVTKDPAKAASSSYTLNINWIASKM